MARYTFVIFNNGREVENLDAGTFATHEEALAAAEAALDDVCPKGSNMRRFYRAEVRSVYEESQPMSKHTPGPWHVGIEPTMNTIRIRDNGMDALPIATIFYSDGGKPRYQREESTANARLIAAAPDLLEACIEAHECIRTGGHFADSNRTMERLAAAIAKAEGKA